MLDITSLVDKSECSTRSGLSRLASDLLKDSPVILSPPNRKRVWSDTGVRVCMERPTGTKDERKSLEECRVFYTNTQI